MRLYQLGITLLVITTAAPSWSDAKGELWPSVNSQQLIGQWCLRQQSLSGYDYSTVPPKNITDHVKAAPGQQYHFKNSNTVVVTGSNGAAQEFTYEIKGEKSNRVRIKRWGTFKMKRFHETEMVATMLSTLHHRFTAGPCGPA